MRVQDVIAEFIESTRVGMHRYLAGFSDANHTTQAVNLPNHAAWNVGHLALTMHRVAEMLDGQSLPEADFRVGAAEGDANRFGTEAVSFGSTPVDDSRIYPTWSRCIAIFDAACARLAAAVRSAADATLETQVPWGPMQLPLYLLALRMGSHNGVHLGQLADLRRALRFQSVFV